MKYDIVLLREHPELTARASEWFSSKWNIPKEEYDKSIAECIKNNDAVPQWYLVFDDGGNIAAGLGVIKMTFTSGPTLRLISARFLLNLITAAAELQGLCLILYAAIWLLSV